MGDYVGDSLSSLKAGYGRLCKGSIMGFIPSAKYLKEENWFLVESLGWSFGCPHKPVSLSRLTKSRASKYIRPHTLLFSSQFAFGYWSKFPIIRGPIFGFPL